MKFLLISLILSFAAMADESKKQEHFAKMKEHMIKNIDMRIEANQKTKACIQAASKHEEMKECHHKMKQEMEKIKESSSEMREGLREMKKQKRQERKKNKES